MKGFVIDSHSESGVGWIGYAWPVMFACVLMVFNNVCLWLCHLWNRGYIGASQQLMCSNLTLSDDGVEPRTKLSSWPRSHAFLEPAVLLYLLLMQCARLLRGRTEGSVCVCVCVCLWLCAHPFVCPCVVPPSPVSIDWECVSESVSRHVFRGCR